MMIIIKILRRGCYVKKFKRYMARIPFEGGGKGKAAIPFSRSFRNKESNPPALFRKIKFKIVC
jgi:hypothetical protein